MCTNDRYGIFWDWVDYVAWDILFNAELQNVFLVMLRCVWILSDMLPRNHMFYHIECWSHGASFLIAHRIVIAVDEVCTHPLTMKYNCLSPSDVFQAGRQAPSG
jgi:hypothetical protein